MGDFWAIVKEDPGHDVTRIELKNFCKPESPWSTFPYLKSTKCADTRHLIPALHRACRDTFGNSELERSIILLLQLLSRMYEILDEPTVFLSTTLSGEFKQRTWDFLSMYSYLAKTAMDCSILRWSLVPKFHMVYHIAVSSRINPSCLWCYQGEDFIGKVICICQACSRGTHQLHVALKGCNRWRLMMHVTLTRA